MPCQIQRRVINTQCQEFKISKPLSLLSFNNVLIVGSGVVSMQLYRNADSITSNNISFINIVLASLLVISIVHLSINCINEEIVSVYPNFGIEFCQRYGIFKLLSRKQFIEWDEIDTIIINEGFNCNQVHYYLAFLNKNETKLYLPFKVDIFITACLL